MIARFFLAMLEKSLAARGTYVVYRGRRYTIDFSKFAIAQKNPLPKKRGRFFSGLTTPQHRFFTSL
jgi:hypothetical protein